MKQERVFINDDRYLVIRKIIASSMCRLPKTVRNLYRLKNVPTQVGRYHGLYNDCYCCLGLMEEFFGLAYIDNEQLKFVVSNLNGLDDELLNIVNNDDIIKGFFTAYDDYAKTVDLSFLPVSDNKVADIGADGIKINKHEFEIVNFNKDVLGNNKEGKYKHFFINVSFPFQNTMPNGINTAAKDAYRILSFISPVFIREVTRQVTLIEDNNVRAFRDVFNFIYELSLNVLKGSKPGLVVANFIHLLNPLDLAKLIEIAKIYDYLLLHPGSDITSVIKKFIGGGEVPASIEPINEEAIISKLFDKGYIVQDGEETKSSFERRYANINEIPCFWYAYNHDILSTTLDKVRHNPLWFPKNKPVKVNSIRPNDISWEHFVKKLLPGIKSISFIPMQEKPYPFAIYTQAVHKDMPPILKWDNVSKRNSLTCMTVQEGIKPEAIGLKTGIEYEVYGVTYLPHEIDIMERNMANKTKMFSYDGACILLAIPGMINCRGYGLFPDVLNSDLKEEAGSICSILNNQILPGSIKEGTMAIQMSRFMTSPLLLKCSFYNKEGAKYYYITSFFN